MAKIKIGLLSKKRGNFRLQERIAGAENVHDETAGEVAHHRKALKDAGYQVVCIPWGDDFIHRLTNTDIDLVFNVSSLVEAAILEDLEIPFCGSGTSAIVLASNKSLAKRLWQDAGIPTSPFRVLRDLEDCRSFIMEMPFSFPLFVKPVAGRGSAGINQDSLIRSDLQLIQRTEILLETIKQPVLVERFLAGREVTIGVIGNGDALRPMPPLEIRYRHQDQFLTFDKKEQDEDQFICPADLTDEQLGQLQTYALKAFRTLGMRDFARFDTKLNPEGFMFLEANSFAGLMCTPAETPKSYIGFMARAEGMGGRELLDEIVQTALERMRQHERLVPKSSD